MSNEFSTEELEEYRVDILNELIEAVQIIHVDLVTDDYGGQSEQTTTTDTVALFGPTGAAKELEIANRLQVSSPYTFTLPYGTIITEKDRIKHIVSDITYEVVSVTNFYSYQIAVTALCERVL